MDYFKIQEYVPEEIYKQYGAKSIWFINPKLIESDIVLRKYFNVPIIINNWYWYWNGKRNYSGFRPRKYKVGADLSQHRLGNASDKFFCGLDAQEVQREIVQNIDKFPLIGGIEIGVSWVHTDVRPRINGKITIFYK